MENQKYILLRPTDTIQADDEICYNYDNKFIKISLVYIESRVRELVVRRKVDNVKVGDYLLLKLGDNLVKHVDEFLGGAQWVTSDQYKVTADDLIYRRLVTKENVDQINDVKYYYLKVDETIKEGDEYTSLHNETWFKCLYSIGTNVGERDALNRLVRRKVTKPAPATAKLTPAPDKNKVVTLYSMLEPDETIQTGDEYCNNNQWWLVWPGTVGTKARKDVMYRRAVYTVNLTRSSFLPINNSTPEYIYTNDLSNLSVYYN
jgi:hypothetical protein